MPDGGGPAAAVAGLSEARVAEALAAARRLIAARAEEGRHHVACAVLTETAMYLGLNLECMLPRAGSCAEPVAIGAARAAEGPVPIVFSVAVNRRGEVIPPCGVCRELLIDYGPGAEVAVDEVAGRLVQEPLRALLPVAYKAHLRCP